RSGVRASRTVTFRARLVLVAAVAVVVAVFAASAASYLAARNSLLSSVDGTLRATADATLSRPALTVPRTAIAGLDYQFVASTGELVSPRSDIPITTQAKAVAAGKVPAYFADITIRGADYRELVVSAGTVTVNTHGFPVGKFHAALLLVLPLASVDNQLAHLESGLGLVAALGIALALLLAWLVGRTALVPLNELTAAVEGVAATSDVSRRLDPGGVDELGRLRRAFNHLLSALDRSQRAQRQLVLDAGHELRTPLTSLRTNLEVLRRVEELSPAERDVLVDDVLTQMGELTTLVADLSELARGEQRPSAPTTLRLDRVVEDAVTVAGTHGRPRGVRFDLAASPTWVVGHRDRLDRAVGNLLDNALKWSPEGGVVEVHCEHGTVAVRDHGPGIAAEDLPHIFDRFYRASGARQLPGSGLGLAIVAQVAHSEGGTVTADAAPGGGALFHLRLPAVPPPPIDGSADTDDE
ncbi:MAG: ATP-binding protein, partial [Gaiellaceae bacterium]